jgi:hypothetical protein
MRTALLLAGIAVLMASPAVAGPHKNDTIPLGKYEKYQELLNKAAGEIALINIDVRASTKEYEHDVYQDLGFKKVRVSCVRFKSSSRFALKVDVPTFTVSGDTLKVDQKISRLTADGLHARFQLGPCMEHSTGFGFTASDIHFITKAKPTLRFDAQGKCSLIWGGDSGDIDVKIGDFNARGVQNDLDKLVKKWAAKSMEEALNAAYPSRVGPLVSKIAIDFCGKG